MLNTRYASRRQLAGDAHRDGGCRRRSAEARHGRERHAGGDGDRQRRLSLELPGSAQRDAGGGDVADGATARQHEPIFRSLFQAGERTQPISPAVQELWGSNLVADLSGARTLSGHTPEVRAPGRLDLFSDRNGTFSS